MQQQAIQANSTLLTQSQSQSNTSKNISPMRNSDLDRESELLIKDEEPDLNQGRLNRSTLRSTLRDSSIRITMPGQSQEGLPQIVEENPNREKMLYKT